jgi:hypothetical protein
MHAWFRKANFKQHGDRYRFRFHEFVVCLAFIEEISREKMGGAKHIRTLTPQFLGTHIEGIQDFALFLG